MSNFLQKLSSLKLTLAAVLLAVVLLIPSAFVAPNVVEAQAGFCGTLSNEFRGFIDCEEDFTSFTQFEGGLQPVEVEGYDPGLTRATDARQFIKNVVNFALGFLGLIALVVVIYGGFLYVTASFNEEQAQKGKDAIKYAVIGILIILSAFAIVNTAIRAPGDIGDDGRGPGSGGGSSNTRQVAEFNSASEQVKEATVTYIRSYESYFTQSVIVQKMMDYEVSKLTTRQDILDYLTFIRRNLVELQQRSIPVERDIAIPKTSLTNTALAARVTIDNAIDPAIRLLEDVIEDEANEEEVARLYRYGFGKFFDDIRGAVDDIGEGFNDLKDGIGDLFTSNSEDKGFNVRDEDVNCYLPPELRSANQEFDCIGEKEVSANSDSGTNIVNRVNTFLQEVVVEFGINRDYNERIDSIKRDVEDIQDSLVSFNRPGNPNESIAGGFEAVLRGLEASRAENISYTIDITDDEAVSNSIDVSEAFENSQTVRRLLESFNALFEQLDQIEFVAAFIQANVVNGSAPLVVRFDGSGSIDPADETLIDDKFEWDLDGDGDFNEGGSDECSEEASAVVGCIYRTPGSYRVALRVKSNDEDRIAPGLAFLTIRVQEPIAKIDLKASFGERTGDDAVVIREYNEDGFLERDVDEIRLTLSDASAGGIQFDATGTADNSEASGSKIIRYSWDFGDGTPKLTGSETEAGKPDPHQYVTNGTYRVALEVEDEAGNKDRKIFDVVVTSLAAAVDVNQTRGDLNTQFAFDANKSKSDGGEITQYNWSVEGIPDSEIETDPKSPFFRHIFDTPGSYNVTVQVQDSVGNVDQDTITVLVESKAPQALYTIDFLPNQPSTVVLDATDSFDPDENDVLKYTWVINAREGSDYEILEGQLVGNENDAGRLKIKFKKQRNFVVTLKVEDQHTDPRLRKEVTEVIDVNIQTLIDLALGEDHEPAAVLKDGEAEVTIDIDSEFAKEIEINFGDGQEEEGLFAGGEYKVKHTYDRAGLYRINIVAKGDNNDRNEMQTTVTIGEGDELIPVVTMSYDGIEYSLDDELPVVSRGEIVSFDASRSLNNDGTTTGISSYSWNFGDNGFGQGAKEEHVFRDLAPNPPGYFEISLQLRNNDGLEKPVKFNLKVESVPPVIQGIRATPLDPEDRSAIGADRKLVTPFPVRIEALGVHDKDGEVEEYRYYYVPVLDSERKLGVKTSAEPVAEIEVDTLGVQDEKNDFYFCVDLIDNEGNEVICQERFGPDIIPKLTVTNGKNDQPIAEFTVDRSNVFVGEEITFNSSSTDPDGEIVSYQWDIDGDGSFANDPPQTSSLFKHTYTRRSGRNGYVVRLKVVDDKGATAVSDPVVIAVDSILEPPTAAFRAEHVGFGAMQFTSNSSADVSKGGEIVRLIWDFNLAVDSDGDGDKTNDIDSESVSPQHVYTVPGTYRGKLTVVDSEGNVDEVENDINVPQFEAALTDDFNFGGDNGGQTDSGGRDGDGEGFVGGANPGGNSGGDPNTGGLEAVLTTNPPYDPFTKTISLPGTQGSVTFYFNESRGNIARYVIDSNRLFDSDGDGSRNTDVSFQTTDRNDSFTVDYRSDWEPLQPQLIVYDAQGNADEDYIIIDFAGNNFGATLRGLDNPIVVIVLLAIIGFLGVSLYDYFPFAKKPAKRRRRRKLTR